MILVTMATDLRLPSSPPSLVQADRRAKAWRLAEAHLIVRVNLPRVAQFLCTTKRIGKRLANNDVAATRLARAEWTKHYRHHLETSQHLHPSSASSIGMMAMDRIAWKRHHKDRIHLPQSDSTHRTQAWRSPTLSHKVASNTTLAAMASGRDMALNNNRPLDSHVTRACDHRTASSRMHMIMVMEGHRVLLAE